MNMISRRKFMSAIAALGVTFTMAGCQATKPPVTSYQPQTKVINVDENDSFVINSIDCGTTHDGYVQLDFTLVNNTANDISFTEDDAAVDGGGSYRVNVKAYFDGKYEKVNAVKGSGIDNLMSVTLKGADDDMIINNYMVDGAFYVKAPDEWNSMTFVFTMLIDNEPVEAQFSFTH